MKELLNATSLTEAQKEEVKSIYIALDYMEPENLVSCIFVDHDRHEHTIVRRADLDDAEIKKLHSRLVYAHEHFYFSGSMCLRRSKATKIAFSGKEFGIDGLASIILAANPFVSDEFLLAEITDYVYRNVWLHQNGFADLYK